MSEGFKAETQYGDLIGTAAFDGYDGAPLFDMAKLTDMPKTGYRPVGFSFYTVHVTDGTIPFNVVAVKISEAGDSLEEITRYAESHNGEIPLYSFDGKIKPDKLESLFKRARVKVVLKHMAHFKFEVKEVV